MKKILVFIMICTMVLGCMPADVLSEGTTASDAMNKLSAKDEPQYIGPAKVIFAPEPSPEETSAEEYALTLSDCYRMALLQSEIIAINADLIKETEAHFLQAISIVMPHIAFLSTDTQEANNGSSSGSSTLGSLNPIRSSTRAFNGTMTLFNGFKAIAAIKGSKYERIARIDEKIRAEQLLLLDVANAFYLLIEERQDIKVLEMTRNALRGRVKELQARERLGRSRPSEIVNAKAQFYSVEASLEVSRSQEVLARQLLEFLVGQSVRIISDTYDFPIPLMPEDFYVMKADGRPDVEATKFAWQLSKEGITVADSGFLPQVDFAANYYTQRTGFEKGTDWDVALMVNIPIFDGGETLGNSKAANLQADEARLTYHRTRRHAPYDIKDTYVTLVTAMSVYKALRKAYTTAKLNYHMQKKDYARNLVNNLDVLASIQTLQDAERNYIHALYEAKRQYWKLRVAVGQGGTETLDDAF